MPSYEIRTDAVIRMQRRSVGTGEHYVKAPELTPACQSGHAVPVGTDETVCGLYAVRLTRVPGDWEHLNPWSRCEDCERQIAQESS
jgi:hypothetical protein